MTLLCTVSALRSQYTEGCKLSCQPHDTFPHEVTNGSDEVRAVLLLDVWRRGMPLDMRLLSRLLIFIVGVMARIRE